MPLRAIRMGRLVYQLFDTTLCGDRRALTGETEDDKVESLRDAERRGRFHHVCLCTI